MVHSRSSSSCLTGCRGSQHQTARPQNIPVKQKLFCQCRDGFAACSSYRCSRWRGEKTYFPGRVSRSVQRRPRKLGLPSHLGEFPFSSPPPLQEPLNCRMPVYTAINLTLIPYWPGRSASPRSLCRGINSWHGCRMLKLQRPGNNT